VKKDKPKMSKADIDEAVELMEVQSKIFTPTFNEILTDIVHDLNERDGVDEEFVKKISSLMHKRNIGECVIALTYLLSVVTSEKRFMRALRIVENERMEDTQNYIG